MIITKSQIENAISLLKQEADGSQSNQQARRKARQVIAEHIEQMGRFTVKAGQVKNATIKKIEYLKSL
jgi:hypothetical protein